MIKFEYTEVFNFAGAFRGMRNPMDSWELSDSYHNEDGIFRIGPADMKLAQKLIRAGSDHRKFMRQIFVSVDITAPLYWWKEFDTYKVGTVANSCSTMHRIHAKELTIDDFSHEHLVPISKNSLLLLIATINAARNCYNENTDKGFWWQLIQLLPSSYNQRRTITLDYENLRSMYHARKGHKLDEWKFGFMAWIDTLPYADELIKC